MLEQYFYSLWVIVIAHSVFFTEIAVVVALVTFFLLKKRQPVLYSAMAEEQKPRPLTKSPIVITSRDIKAIAGDNVMMTQLDLARAYLEIGKTKLAKKILDHVIQHGDVKQQEAAQQLIENL